MRGSTPLGRVLGLGSAKSGVHHWWVERVSAVALIPLGLWLVLSLLTLGDYSHASVTAWIARGFNPALLLLTLLTMVWHSRLGLQVVIEDYVHGPAVKTASLLANTFVHALLAVAGALAVLKIALGAP